MRTMPEKDPSSPRREGRITDARGRRVTQLDPVSMHYLRTRDSIDAETLRTLASEIGIGWPIIVKILFFARATDPMLQSEKIGDYSYLRGSPITSSFFEDQAKFVEKWGRVK